MVVGINHIATLTTNMEATVRFYERVFGAEVTAEVAPSEGHPWMKTVELGGGAALNVFEVPPEAIVGERTQIGGRGAIDHFGIGVASTDDLEAIRQRLVTSDAQEVGDVRAIGQELSLFFRDPDGMELEVLCPAPPA